MSLPRLPAVPDALPAPERTPLAARRSRLAAHYDAHTQAVRAFKAKCEGVEATPALEAECDREAARLQADKARLAPEAHAYIAALRAALEAARTQARAALDAELRGVRDMGFAARAAAFDDWAALAGPAQERLKASLLAAAAGTAVATGGAAVADGAGKAAAGARALAAELRACGVTDPAAFRLLDAVALGQAGLATLAKELGPRLASIAEAAVAKPGGMEALLGLALLAGTLMGGASATVAGAAGGVALVADLAPAAALAGGRPRLAAMHAAVEADLQRLQERAARIEARVRELRGLDAALGTLP